MTRQLHLGGFQIASQVTHSHAAWRHPASDTNFLTPEYYHRIGRILERGRFDFVFFADLLAAPVRFGDGIAEPLRRGTQATATLDPSIIGQHRRGHHPPGCRDHQVRHLLSSVRTRADLLEPGSHHQGPGGVEHRHLTDPG